MQPPQPGLRGVLPGREHSGPGATGGAAAGHRRTPGRAAAHRHRHRCSCRGRHRCSAAATAGPPPPLFPPAPPPLFPPAPPPPCSRRPRRRRCSRRPPPPLRFAPPPPPEPRRRSRWARRRAPSSDRAPTPAVKTARRVGLHSAVMSESPTELETAVRAGLAQGDRPRTAAPDHRARHGQERQHRRRRRCARRGVPDHLGLPEEDRDFRAGAPAPSPTSPAPAPSRSPSTS